MSKKKKYYWAGYCNGKLYWSFEPDYMAFTSAIFLTKTKAKSIFEDVRRIEIVEVKK